MIANCKEFSQFLFYFIFISKKSDKEKEILKY